MPLLKHAKKKLRQDKRRTLANKKVKNLFKSLVKDAKENPTAEAVSAAVSSVDKAVKYNLIHKNKAARIKSSLLKIAPREKAATKKAQREASKAAAPAKTKISKKAKATKVKAVKAAAIKSSTKSTKKKT